MSHLLNQILRIAGILACGVMCSGECCLVIGIPGVPHPADSSSQLDGCLVPSGSAVRFELVGRQTGQLHKLDNWSAPGYWALGPGETYRL